MNPQRLLYKLYVFLLPFGSFFNMGSEGLGFWYYISLSQIIMTLGFFLTVPGALVRKEFEKPMLKWLFMALFMILYTVVCAVVILATRGYLYGESPFSVVPAQLVFTSLFLMSIIYNYECLNGIVQFEELFPIFKIQSTILLIVGFIQYFTILGFGSAYVVCKALSVIFCVRDPMYLLGTDRGITLFGTEGSSVASLCLWLIPFIFLYAYYTKSKFYIVEALLWTFLFFNTGSASNFISFATVLICLLAVIIRRKVPRLFLVGAFILGLVIALMYTFYDLNKISISTDGNHDLHYLLIGKVLDVNNSSTVIRASTVVNDIKVFGDFPLTGIGNGLQGYEFKKNAPAWVFNNSMTQDLLSGSMGIVGGGGSFFASYLSGYGLIGLVVFLLFMRGYRRDCRRIANNLFLRNIFSIGLTIFMYSAWYTVGLNQYVAFLLALPYAASKCVATR